MAGAKELTDTLKQDLGEQIRIQAVPCVGRCMHAPVAVVGKNPVDQASPKSVREAVEREGSVPQNS